MITKAQIKPKPKSAPALVDCTRCETPIAAPANKSPGPKDRKKERKFTNILGQIF